ncbi:MAG TPA: hypothetical protein VN617_00365 [Rhodoferax sp.]|nr:hypothetical protein [Rhodoferax sp.]
MLRRLGVRRPSLKTPPGRVLAQKVEAAKLAAVIADIPQFVLGGAGLIPLVALNWPQQMSPLLPRSCTAASC